ncbi:MAG: hypothetical protein M1828_002271 [Chrysothrix sp. TS-e1954]|nr:MAG: hypothetical protein M1828_002271 [Chrysothrix sp. TS-e1954]
MSSFLEQPLPWAMALSPSPSVSSQFIDIASASARVEDLSLQHLGRAVTLHGYLGPRSDITKSLSFAPLLSPSLRHSVQLILKTGDNEQDLALLGSFRSVDLNTPVTVGGTIQRKIKPKDPSKTQDVERIEDVEIKLEELVVHNGFAPSLQYQDDTILSPERRNLQIRQSRSLRDALAFRSQVSQACRGYLLDQQDFIEVETPLLFKSTPEGAREFLVPTRTKGFAYALPQSPQQYKQILMASGIPRYFQIARCFRDEDLRADRQPEFSQLDLEMSFAGSKEVMECVEALIKHLWNKLLACELGSKAFPTLSYEDVMSRYGSDKPDVRLGMEISRIGHMIPADLISKIGPLADPFVDVFKFSVSEEPSNTRTFISAFMDSSEAKPFINNADGQPGIFIYDSRKPLGGLQPFGFEAAEHVENILELEEGDMVVLQARSREAFSGGSTPLGNLRLALHRFAVDQGYMSPPIGWEFLWVNQFPLFSPTNETDPGQGGFAGLSSTHHPFTAPAGKEDFDLLGSRPLETKADHYDLVLNGVELGGGSRRIHDAVVQEYILRDVLKMGKDRLSDFAHLLEVLRGGCPPHAGIALGFDRLCAVMLGRDSIRDVIAFPKGGSGQDMLVKSPSKLTKAQLDTYHLQLKP